MFCNILPKRDKLSPKADVYVLMEYCSTQKGYLLYEITSKKVIVSRDVTFKETIFPFKKMHSDSVPLFPNVVPSFEPELV